MSKRPRDITGKCWERRDIDGDTIVIYTPRIGVCGVGGQETGKHSGFAVLLDPAGLDAFIQELQDRRARMP